MPLFKLGRHTDGSYWQISGINNRSYNKVEKKPQTNKYKEIISDWN